MAGCSLVFAGDSLGSVTLLGKDSIFPYQEEIAMESVLSSSCSLGAAAAKQGK